MEYQISLQTSVLRTRLINAYLPQRLSFPLPFYTFFFLFPPSEFFFDSRQSCKESGSPSLFCRWGTEKFRAKGKEEESRHHSEEKKNNSTRKKFPPLENEN